MSPDTRLRAGAAAAVLALAAAIVAGQVAPSSGPAQPQQQRRHTRVGSAPPGSRCLEATVRVTPEALGLFGLDPERTTDAGLPRGTTYARVRLAALASDAGGLGLPPGVVALEDSLREAACPDAGGGLAALEAWVGEAAPYPCACARAADAGACEQLRGALGVEPTWQTALPGTTLPEGQWRGPGCRPKPCVELAGSSSWPEECAP